MLEVDVYCDGSIKGGNPGGWGVGGYVVKVPELKSESTGTIDLGEHDTMTNNIAEYSAVVAALSEVTGTVKDLEAQGYEVAVVAVHCDSKLVVEQCTDNWACNNPRLSQLRDEIWSLCEDIGCDVTFTWIPREENTEADAVSRSLYEC